MYTYELWCDSEVYVGFTSRSPTVRWEEHKEAAKEGRKTKFYDALRSHSITKSSSTIHENEIAALVSEIEKIEFYTKKGICLNMTAGGEGNNWKVRIRDGKVEIRPVSKKVKQQRRAWYARKRRRRRR